MNCSHIILQSFSIIDAIRCINEIHNEPLVLFVVDENKRMQGTLTDGDVRRALIKGIDVDAPISEAMHRNFNFLRRGVNDRVEDIHHQRDLRMRLVPILDEENHICEIINLEHYVTKLPIDAVLMAGGKGERLRPLTEKTPKPLIKVGDKCIIDYNIDRLLSYGLNHISVTVNYLGDQIEEHFREERDGVKIVTVREPKYLGTIGSIKFVETFYNDTVLVMNSDLFTNIDFEDFFLHFCQHDINGKFTQRQLEIYSVVEKAHDYALELAKPGVKYMDVHFGVCKIIFDGMKELGLAKGDTEEAVRQGAHAMFLPHGLGHMMGMDVHDMEALDQIYVGFDEETRPNLEQFGTNCLRMGRRLQEGFVVTDEPGIYFIPDLIDDWRASGHCKDFLCFDKLDEYKDFGGIRLEDDILITADGCRFLGKDTIPIRPKDVEEFMAQARG